MALVGPGAQQPVTEDVKPLLADATEYEYITLLNPLSDDFAVRVSQDIPVNLPVQIRNQTGLVQTGNDVVRSYGLDLKNPEFQARKHVFSDTVIESGKTKRFKGNEAQVAVRQLVNEILQRRGKKRLMADPTLRREIEQEIIIDRGSIQDLMETQLQTPRAQMDAAIAKSNEVQDEPAFPTVAQPAVDGLAAESEDSHGDSVQQERRNPGRPKKA